MFFICPQNFASTFLCNKKTNKKTKNKKKNKTKKDKNGENEIQVSGGLLMASGISDWKLPCEVVASGQPVQDGA